MNEILKELLGENFSEEAYEKIIEAINENYVPKEEHENILGTSDGDEKFAEMENQYKDEIKQIRLQHAIDSALSACGAKNTKAVYALLDKEQMNVDENGTVQGIEEQLKALQKSDNFLFETKEVKGLKPAESADEVYKIPEEMTYEELCEFFKK